METIDMICSRCDKIMTKRLSYVKHRKKKTPDCKFYCDSRCAASTGTTYTEIICANPNCGKIVKKILSRVKILRKTELDYKFYCDTKCKKATQHTKIVCANPNCGKTVTKALHLIISGKKRNPDCKFYCNTICSGNIVLDDEKSDLRFVWKECERAAKRKDRDFNITIDYLEQLWKKQDGKCPFTGKELIIKKSARDKMSRAPDRLSIDRIDSSKGYVIDNIQLVSMMFNFAKSDWKDQDVLDFCQDVVNNQENNPLGD